jgi:hypothetical protein
MIYQDSSTPLQGATHMAENESLKKVLELYLQQKRDKLEEVRQLDLIIARLSRDIGEPTAESQIAEAPSDSMADSWREKVEMVLLPAGGRSTVRPDEFFGMTYTAAASAYLERVGHAVSMDELLDALNKGGCPVGGKEPKKTLYISLIRAVKTFVPIPGKTGFLGLRKFYPNLKAVKESREDSEPRTKRKKRRKKKTIKSTDGKAEAKPKTGRPAISAKEKSRPLADQATQKEVKATM